MTTLPVRLDRNVLIGAGRKTSLFRYSTGSARWAFWWWGHGFHDRRPAGRPPCAHPDGSPNGRRGRRERSPPCAGVNVGFVSGKPDSSGASRVTIVLNLCRGHAVLLPQRVPGSGGARDDTCRLAVSALSCAARSWQTRRRPRRSAGAEMVFAPGRGGDAQSARGGAGQNVATPDEFKDRFSAVTACRPGDHLGAAQRSCRPSTASRREEVRTVGAWGWRGVARNDGLVF